MFDLVVLSISCTSAEVRAREKGVRGKVRGNGNGNGKRKGRKKRKVREVRGRWRKGMGMK